MVHRKVLKLNRMGELNRARDETKVFDNNKISFKWFMQLLLN